MGAWGTAISSNDTYADIYGEFFDLYNYGLDVAEISKKLITDNQETINDTDDCNNFWFALAKAQWECKQLNKDIFERVKNVIETGSDLQVWQKLDACEKDIKKRKVVLEKFLNELQTERPKAKSRKKKIVRQPIFEKGDCVIFELGNENYGGVIVLEAIKDTELGLNLIALTRINSKVKPILKDFENSEILTKSFATSHSVTLQHSYDFPVASLHYHTNYYPASVGDVYSLINAYGNFNSYGTFFIASPNGSVYALVVNNPSAMTNFLSQYPPSYSTNPDGSVAVNFPAPLNDLYNDVAFDYNSNTQSSYEVALAYMLDTYNMGIALTKMNSAGNFQKLGANKSTTADGSPKYEQTKCP